MDADTQEAQSRKYYDAARVLHLSSGNFAIFAGLELYTIFANPASVGPVIASDEFKAFMAEHIRDRSKSPAIQVEDVLNEVKVDLGDIEL